MALFGLKKDSNKNDAQKGVPTEAKKAKPAAAKAVKAPANAGAKIAKPKAVKSVKSEKPVAVSSAGSSGSQLHTPNSTFSIIRPHITEKSGILSQGGVYTFQVSKEATKKGISDAIVALYKVTPVKVGIVNLPSKSVFVRGKRGHVAGIKKAIVTVKKGDKIDFV